MLLFLNVQTGSRKNGKPFLMLTGKTDKLRTGFKDKLQTGFKNKLSNVKILKSQSSKTAKLHPFLKLKSTNGKPQKLFAYFTDKLKTV